MAIAGWISSWSLAGSLVLVVVSTFSDLKAADVDRLVVHEWGTFTSLQDEQGRELSGINTDDEPVPKFVHNLNPFVLGKPLLSSQHWIYRQKAVPRVHPYVTMRLETPVVYFYPPSSWKVEKTIDVSVRLRGGWLTEFYPGAHADAPGLAERKFEFGKLTPETTSSLAWKDLQIGSDGVGPETNEHVWLAPRQVAAANVTSDDGESERYLFYRGVGNQRAPLRAAINRRTGELTLYSNFDDVLASGESASIPALWLVHVRRDGQCAFRALEMLRVSGDVAEPLAKAGYRFPTGGYERNSRAQLVAAMHGALTAEGLYADEATALLSTWKRSYFASPGLRLFFVVPRVWTDHYLPFTLSVDARVERVMVGRLELTSDEQQAGLDRLARADISDGKWMKQFENSPAHERFLAGRSEFGDLGVAIPRDFQTYLDLGRFRNALVVHEERMRPTASLTKFINTYALQPFRVEVENKATTQAASQMRR